MHGPAIRRLEVWSTPLRLCHWALTLAVMVLLLSGWLIRWAPERADQVRDAHFVAAAVLVAALVVRLGLFFLGSGPAALRALLPDRHRLGQALAVLRSYLTLGKLPLPRWYAHNPLWAPLYLLLYVVLLGQVLTGAALLQQVTMIGELSLRGLHAWGYFLVMGFAAGHVLASFVHDAWGKADDVSAMINGQRIFTLEPLQEEQSPGGVVVPLSTLSRRDEK